MSKLASKIKEKGQPCFIREYRQTDYDRCLEIYRSNEGSFIASGYISEFTDFLSEPTSFYFVVEDRIGHTVGCGGVELFKEEPNCADLTFGMIDRSLHRRGFGTSLLGARISILSEELEIGMETSLEAVGFYARYGFELDSVTPDRLGKGNDYGNLILDVTEEDKRAVKKVLTEIGVNIQLKKSM